MKRRKTRRRIIWGALLCITLGGCLVFSSIQAYRQEVITVQPKGSPAKLIEYRLDPSRFNTELVLRSASGALMVAVGVFLLLLRRLVSPERYESAMSHMENASPRGSSLRVPAWLAVLIIGALIGGLIYLLSSAH